jgi:hypothetical protein
MLALFTLRFTPSTHVVRAATEALDPEHIDPPDQVGEGVGALPPQVPAIIFRITEFATQRELEIPELLQAHQDIR